MTSEDCNNINHGDPSDTITTTSKQDRNVSRLLIDVDCNLWHNDLTTLLLQPLEDQMRDPLLLLPRPFQILQQDNIASVQAIVSPSCTLQEATEGLQALRQYTTTLVPAQQQPHSLPMIRTTVGIHPYHVNDQEFHGKDMADHLKHAEALLTGPYQDLCVAVGECGLDAAEGFPALLDQIPWFAAQIALAEMLSLPLFVHERLAFDDTMKLLEGVHLPILIHCFTGTWEECKAYIDRGYYISISGYIFREEAEAVRQCLQQNIIPLDKLMLETDAPFMGFPGCRDSFLDHNSETIQATLTSKKRRKLASSQYPNVPSALYAVFDKVLYHLNLGRSMRGEAALSELFFARQTSRNSDEFFRLGLTAKL